MRLETERLVLRRWREEDLAPMAGVNADPEVMRWIGDGTTRDEETTRAGIEAAERSWEERGFGLFALEERATGRMLGFAGLAVPLFLPEILPAVEIGWRLDRAHWGRGLATEAARAALAYGFGEAGLDRVVSVVQTGNRASERITEKLGMVLHRETVSPGPNRAVRVYALDRPRPRP
ncbi:GNAT family N-acetyltransferase [Streptomyces diastatochromogenes]|nr:GNAT family N-acetyltransferase [Streptomyces diastatochromogenes]